MNKHAEVKLMGKIVLVLIILGLFAFILPNFLYGGVNSIQLEKCKQVYNYDGDDFGIDDKCHCDYGNKDTMNAFQLKNTPGCVFSKEGEKYIYDESSSQSLESCAGLFVPLKGSSSACKDVNLEKGIGLKEGFSEECAKVVLLVDSSTKELVRICKTPDIKCNEIFKGLEQCKKA